MVNHSLRVHAEDVEVVGIGAHRAHWRCQSDARRRSELRIAPVGDVIFGLVCKLDYLLLPDHVRVDKVALVPKDEDVN